MKSSIFLALPALCCSLVSFAAPQPGPTARRTDIPVRVRSGARWVSVPKRQVFSGGYSAVAIRQAINPRTKRPFRSAGTGRSISPGRLRRGFRIKKKNFVLGEPILVEFRVEVPGKGTWWEVIGGNYRGRGRDDNFFFLLRHKDGTWVSDPYGPAAIGGGLSTKLRVQQGKPMSYWLAVQRYSAIIRPGTYELFCFHHDHSYDVAGWRLALAAAIPKRLRKTHRLGTSGNRLVHRRTGRPSRYYLSPSWHQTPSPSPVAARVPKAVVKRVGAKTLAGLGDFARFKIVIKAPTRAERKRMVKRWRSVVQARWIQRWPTPYSDAAREAMWFARQDDFLPVIAHWLKSKSRYRPQDTHGLAMRPSRRALNLLFKNVNDWTVGALYHLNRANIRHAIGPLIKLLTHPESRVRASAATALQDFTRKRFGINWRGYHWQRPTMQEGRRMRPLWQRWWKANRNTFTPRKRGTP